VLTGNAIFEVAHIYPDSLINPSSTTDSPYNIWDILKVFWSDDRIQKWRNVIFPYQDSPDKGIETCHNLLCLSPDAHAYWTKAYFVLKPIKLSDDEKRLDVKFYWTPKYDYPSKSKVDILITPQSSEGSDSRAKIMLFHFPTNRQICSGDTISLTTDDPVTRPLPRWELLEMQWILHRLTAMRGGAEIYDDFDSDDDGEDERDSYMEDDDWNSYEEE